MTRSAAQVSPAIVVFDIDGVIRDVGGSYRLALADTVESFTQGAFRPSPPDIDALKTEGLWNNDWEASRELIYRYYEAQGQQRDQIGLDYEAVITFFQSRYRGPNPDDSDHWTGYICQEPLLVEFAYLETLTQAQIAWGFFSGATRGSASYILEKRLGLQAPILVAMEDAPGKPDPTGLLMVVQQLEERDQLESGMPVIYVGDTVADLQTVQQARKQQPQREWIGVGILPPHAQQSAEYANTYTLNLQQVEAQIVLSNVEQLDPKMIQSLIRC
ncbi:MAG: TIGR01548 family HAD-type hydrolase [Cyanobacteria bacterium RM1_2_2]|nr:TIGR01548 family HAD-type hydrolase [Cyanobacteria bacterium RM1_2_2]